MTEDEYKDAYDIIRHDSFSGNSATWNQEYREKLEKNGLMISGVEPKDRWCIMAPIPTPQDVEGIVPHTPETDPFAWDMPAWIIPKS